MAMANISLPVDPSYLDSLFFELTKRRAKNLVPLCKLCSNEKAERLDVDAAPATHMCLTCWPSCILCKDCVSAHSDDYQNHMVIHLKDVWWNIYSAFVGLPVAPLKGCAIHLLSDDGTSSPVFNFKAIKHSPEETSKLPAGFAIPRKVKSAVRKHTVSEPVDLIRNTKPRRVVFPMPRPKDTDLSWPYGLCISPTGGILIADTYNHRILVVSDDGNTAHEFENDTEGRDRPMPSNDSYPIGVCCSEISPRYVWNVNVAVAESGNGLVRIYNSAGRTVQKITEGLRRPHGVKFSTDWYILVTDISNQTLTKYSCIDGRIVRTFSEPKHGEVASRMSQPSYVECSDDGRMIFVSDTANRCVKVYDDVSGEVVKTLHGFSSPHGLCTDPEQRALIVADFGRSSVSMVDLRQDTVVGEVAGLTEGLIGPTDLAYHAPSRQILVLDTTRNKVLQFPIRPLPFSDVSEFGFSTDPWQEETSWFERPAPKYLS